MWNSYNWSVKLDQRDKCVLIVCVLQFKQDRLRWSLPRGLQILKPSCQHVGPRSLWCPLRSFPLNHSMHLHQPVQLALEPPFPALQHQRDMVGPKPKFSGHCSRCRVPVLVGEKCSSSLGHNGPARKSKIGLTKHCRPGWHLLRVYKEVKSLVRESSVCLYFHGFVLKGSLQEYCSQTLHPTS